ncbi:GIY-YIG nuclease family protein [Nitrospina gracilis]|uniref:GIY-YIG nuclease family protein n=1 Tax=Nitrospina gracilis TaxID=35801 RepID=UPI001F357CA9|nr:GIY-YIG nuclease family protein [Nitrospina gracilis]MCF8721674.1 putative endonuclease [Nitrospina gracilis Nb-211]
MSDWYVYLVRVRNGSLYTGVTRDVERRLSEHEAGGPRGAKFFRGKGPLELVFQESVGERSQALRAEAAIKKLRKAEKEKLVRGEVALHALLASPDPRIENK